MEDLIKVKSASYKRYEELLLEKDALIKESEGYKMSYDALFDGINNEVRAARLECVKKRKIISYCKSMLSLGSIIKQSKLDEFVSKAMQDYKDTLDFLSKAEQEEDENKKSEKSKEELKKVKSTYHQLAKLIHPDMNDDFKNDNVMRDLWNRTCIAYNCSNLEELEELEVLINRYLESINKKHFDIEIPDINEKIFILNREITKIKHTNPYQYKYFLQDEESIERKKEELKKELNDYLTYEKELDDEIATFESSIEKD